MLVWQQTGLRSVSVGKFADILSVRILTNMGVVLLMLLMILTGVLLSYAFIIYVYRKTAFCKSLQRLDGKVVVITGGSSGIGLEVALDLTRRGAKVYLASRTEAKGLAAVEYIRAATHSSTVYYVQLDLSDFHSVKSFADYVTATEPCVDLLINHAGIGASYEDRTKDGNDLIFTTNYLGHFLLTYLLIDLLKKSTSSRIINTSSIAHSFVKTLDLSSDRSVRCGDGDCIYSRLAGYDMSKLALVLHVKELTRRLAGSTVTANAVNPGICLTSFWSRTGLRWPWFMAAVSKVILRPMSRTAHAAAQTTIYCAVAEEVQGISGKYFEKCSVARESALARNVDLARTLWDVSMLLTGCRQNGKVVHISPRFRYLDEEELWQKKVQRLTAEKKGEKAVVVVVPETLYPITRA